MHGRTHACRSTNKQRHGQGWTYTHGKPDNQNFCLYKHARTHILLSSTPTAPLPPFPKPQTPTLCLLIQLNHSQGWDCDIPHGGKWEFCMSVFCVWIKKKQKNLSPRPLLLAVIMNEERRRTNPRYTHRLSLLLLVAPSFQTFFFFFWFKFVLLSTLICPSPCLTLNLSSLMRQRPSSLWGKRSVLLKQTHAHAHAHTKDTDRQWPINPISIMQNIS